MADKNIKAYLLLLFIIIQNKAPFLERTNLRNCFTADKNPYTVLKIYNPKNYVIISTI